MQALLDSATCFIAKFSGNREACGGVSARSDLKMLPHAASGPWGQRLPPLLGEDAPHFESVPPPHKHPEPNQGRESDSILLQPWEPLFSSPHFPWHGLG